MTNSIIPKVFVSATSSDLRSARKIVSDALIQIGCLPDEESIFGTEYGEVRLMIEKRMADCDAVIHLVGRDYGGEPNPATLPEGQARRSWAQLEYDYAIDSGMKLNVMICADTYPYDSLKSGVAGEESEDCRVLQAAHRREVLAGKSLWHQVANANELRERVAELKEPAERWRAEIEHERAKRRRLTQRMIGVGVAILLALVGLGRKIGIIGNTLENIPERTAAEVIEKIADPDELSVRLRNHIEIRFETERNEARARKANWEEIRELESRRDVALGQVDDLIRTIQDGLAGKPDPIFAEASRIIVDEGPEASIAYLESHRTDILQRVKHSAMQEVAAREKKHKALEPLLLEAELHRAGLRWEDALLLYQTVVEWAPQWSRARCELGRLLATLARYDESEFHLKMALNLAESDGEQVPAANQLGLFYQMRARWAQAEPLLKSSLKLSEQLYGKDSVETAAILNNLGSLLQDTSRFSEAEPLYQRALAIDESVYSRNHPTVAIRLNNLASLLQDTNRLSEAEPLLRRALSIDEAFYGTDHPRVANSLNNLAHLLHVTNHMSEAESLMRRALFIDESAYGPDHPLVANRLSNLASLFQNTNRLAEAEPLMRRALSIDELSYGPDHPSVAIRLNNLASILRASSRYRAAESLYLRALTIEELSYGARHPRVANSLNNLAQLLQATNRVSTAELLMRRALLIDESTNGPDHRSVAVHLNNLAQLLRATNRVSAAESLMRRALSIDESSYGPDHPIVANCLNNLASLLQATKRVSVAEPLMRRALSIDESSYSPDHQLVANRLNNLASLLQATNRNSAAEPLLHRALSIVESSYGPDHPSVAAQLNNLAQLLLRASRPTEAEPLLRHALIIDESSYGPEHPIVANRLNNLASLLFVPGHYSDAEPLILRVVTIFNLFGRSTGHVHPHMDDALGNYRKLLAAMNLRQEEIERRVMEGLRLSEDLAPIVPAVEQVFGPAVPVADVLAEMDRQYQLEGRSAIWFLALDTPVSPHLDELLGPSTLDFGLDPSVTPKLEQLLGPADPVGAALHQLDESYRTQGKPEIWFLPLDEPIAPKLEQLLSPVEPAHLVLQRLDEVYRAEGKPDTWFLPLDEPISPHLEKLLGSTVPISGPSGV